MTEFQRMGHALIISNNNDILCVLIVVTRRKAGCEEEKQFQKIEIAKFTGHCYLASGRSVRFRDFFLVYLSQALKRYANTFFNYTVPPSGAKSMHKK